MNKYKVILFDLGGVLIELTGVPRMIELANNNCTISELWGKWIKSPAVRSFESGKLKLEEFGEQIVKEFEMDILPAQYIKEFTMWPKGTYPGVNELLLKIKSKIKIGSFFLGGAAAQYPCDSGAKMQVTILNPEGFPDPECRTVEIKR